MRKLKCLLSIPLAAAMSALILQPATAQEGGAKGLFRVQAQNPTQMLNTGVQYWIELHHGDQVLDVNNKYAFNSGDKIRFHIRPNVSGYAYILLNSGSRGEQTVLFPDPQHNDNNKVTSGKDFTIPADGYLTFDENPGTEKLTILVSRSPVDATSYLSAPASERTLIASAATGSKDLVPAKILIGFAPSPIAIAQSLPISHISQSNPVKTKSPTMTPKNQLHKQKTSTKTSTKTSISEGKATAHETAGVVTVVNKDPSGLLAIDVALDHQ